MSLPWQLPETRSQAAQPPYTLSITSAPFPHAQSAADTGATHLVHAEWTLLTLSATGTILPDRPSGSWLTGAVEVPWFYFQQTCFVYSNLFPLSFGGSDLRLKKKERKPKRKKKGKGKTTQQ